MTDPTLHPGWPAHLQWGPVELHPLRRGGAVAHGLGDHAAEVRAADTAGNRVARGADQRQPAAGAGVAGDIAGHAMPGAQWRQQLMRGDRVHGGAEQLVLAE